jgi:transposase
LQRHDFIVLLPVNPATLARYREAFVPSRAKDDPTDAQIALELLLWHREKLQPLQPQSADMRTLATLVEQRRLLVGDKTRITNRLSSTLKEYFPQALDWFEDRDTVLFCDFLQRWPSLKHAKRARQATLRSFFSAHNLRRAPLIEEGVCGIRSATALTDDPALLGPHQLLVQTLVVQLRVTLQAIDRFDAEITEVDKRLPDYALFAALPGAGSILAPRLLVAFGEQRERYASAAQLQQYAGVAPVLEGAAATSVRSIGAWPVQPSCVRPSSNGRGARSLVRSGPVPITTTNVPRDAHTRPPCAPWPTSGFALYRCWQTRTPTTSPSTCMPSSAAARR